MRPALTTIGLRLLACAAATWLLWHMVSGPLGLAFAAPLVGVALARPLMDLIGASYAATRQLALQPLEGRHFEHRGVPLDIAEDERHHRWVSVRDLRRLLPGLPRDALLRRLFPDALVQEARGRGLRIEAEALLAHLARCSDPGSLKLRHWLEREVVFPAATRRRRLGIRDRPVEPDSAGPMPPGETRTETPRGD